MDARLLYLWDRVRHSYWFTPSLMAVVAAVLASLTIRLDGRLDLTAIEEAGWIAAWVYTGGANGAREVLSTIAGSMITVAGVVFSITIVALTLASSQFGPRVLSNFMRDPGNQLVLGTFISTFLYCLLVLRTVVGDDNGAAFVPHIAVTLGIALAIASLGVLIYFIHHVSVIIQAPSLVASISKDLQDGIQHIFPTEVPAAGTPPADRAPLLPAEQDGARIASSDGGYLDAVDLPALFELAVRRNLTLRLEFRPGLFVGAGDALVTAWPAALVDEKVKSEVRDAHIIGSRRSALQDVEFSVDQLVEVAVRALSPGVNDPFTAMNCIDHLGAAACQLVRRELSSPSIYDDAGKLRLLVKRPTTPDGIMDAIFHKIRQNARSSTAVYIRLMESLSRAAECVERPEWRPPLQRHADLVLRNGLAGIPEPADQLDLRDRYGRFEQAISRAP